MAQRDRTSTDDLLQELSWTYVGRHSSPAFGVRPLALEWEAAIVVDFLLS